jgi:general bacterial porin, GBP family
MKKLLIATAAMAVVAGAQAQSSVTMYGVFDGGIANVSETTSAGVKTNNSSQGVVNNATSVIGLTGSEDLGGGLKAVFQLEGHLNTNNGQVGSRATVTTTGVAPSTYDSMFNRQAWVGLSDAKYGTLKFGRTADVVDSYEGYSNFSQAFDTEAASANGIGGKNANTVRYDSPVVGGVSVAASYSNNAGGVKSDTAALENANNKVTTYGLNYVTGSLTLGVATGSANVSDSANEGKITTSYAGYNFGFADVRVQNTNNKTAAGVSTKTKEIAAAIPVPMLKGVTAVLHYEDANTSAAAATTTGDYKQTGVALVKELSKRTSLYAAYRDKNRETGATDEVVTAVGVTHKF